MVVTILFCFMNSEVIGQLKRFINISLDSTNRQTQSMAMTQYTVMLNIDNVKILRMFKNKLPWIDVDVYLQSTLRKYLTLQFVIVLWAYEV